MIEDRAGRNLRARSFALRNERLQGFAQMARLPRDQLPGLALRNRSTG